jgi:hypothetical protein
VISAIDRIVIAVPDLDSAIKAYEQLFGVQCLALSGEGAPRVDAPGVVAPRAWLGLANTVIELVQQDLEIAAVVGVVFADCRDTEGVDEVSNERKLNLAVCSGRETASFRLKYPAAQSTRLQVDHLVLRSGDAEACIALFSEQLGIRLALDKTVPEWGGRMLFFRLGKLTLEVIAGPEDRERDDFFWGIAYQCPDLRLLVSHLNGQGIKVSPVRKGRKTGTQVATLKSHTLGISTLLIEPVSSAP